MYRVDWNFEPPNNVPLVRVSLDDRVILEQDLNSYIDRLMAKYPLSERPQQAATVEDMSLKLESPEVELLLLFGYVDISLDVRSDTHTYWFSLSGVYMNEKP